MHCNNLRLVLGLGLVRVSSRVRVRIRVKVRVSVMVRVSIRTSWVVNFALFRCYRPVIYTRPAELYSTTTDLFWTGLPILGRLTAYQSPLINRNGPQRRCLLPQRHCDCRVRVRVKALICRKMSQNGQPCPKQVRCNRIQLRCGPLRSVAIISHTPDGHVANPRPVS